MTLSIAAWTTKSWRRNWSIRQETAWLDEVHASWQGLENCSASSLTAQCDRVRQLVVTQGADSPDACVLAFSLAAESLRRAAQIRLFDVQLLAAKVLAEGGIAEMQTGEGKTLACVPAAVLHALTRRGVHVATPNSYLAQRDSEIVAPACQLLGLSVGLVPEKAGAAEKRPAYQCDITYATANEFGFDYLRDQLTLREFAQTQLGQRAIQRLNGGPRPAQNLIQRELYYTIIDEADNVLLDDAASPLILSGPSEAEATDAAVHRLAAEVASQLDAGEHYRMDPASGTVAFTPAGAAWIHRDDHHVPIGELRRTWSEYVAQAVHSRLLQRNAHYVIDDEGTVQIVDASTGRIFSDRSWQDGLHQAVEAKEGLKVTAERQAIAQITRQRFSRRYERLAGMTGTATGCERELRQVYKLRVHKIPLRTPSLREIWPTRAFQTQEKKWRAIATSVAEIHATGRPILIGTRTIADSETLAALIRDRNLSFALLNGVQDAEEADVIAQAGRRGAVTIATGLAGRGTDIKTDLAVKRLGGLHVVVSEFDASARIDRQLVGRCARQGDPGSAQAFVSAEDILVQRYGPWLARTIDRLADPDGECGMDLIKAIRRIQRAAERTRLAPERPCCDRNKRATRYLKANLSA